MYSCSRALGPIWVGVIHAESGKLYDWQLSRPRRCVIGALTRDVSKRACVEIKGSAGIGDILALLYAFVFSVSTGEVRDGHA